MAQEIVQSSIKILISYILLLVLTRFMGRKMVAQVTFFDFVVAIIIGSVVANISVNQDRPLVSGASVLIVLSLATVSIQTILIKSFSLRKVIDFESVILIENGKIVSKNLKKARLRLDNLLMLLRQKNVFDISSVEFAILESDGQLSVLKKSQKQPVTPADMNIPTEYIGLNKDLIMDGKVIENNLKNINLDKKWLMDKLKDKDYHDIKEVFYACVDTSGNLYISPRS